LIFRVEMLPAQQGDALWIEYGTEPQIHRILVDGGTPPTYKVLKQRIEALAPTDRTFELLIVTHIDTDHIGGVLKLIADAGLGARFQDIWFNDWEDLPTCPVRGPIDGAILTAILEGTGIARNQAFAGSAAAVPDDGPLPSVRLPGGMTLTLLSPGLSQLANLQCAWNTVLRKAGLDPSGPSMEELAERARKKGVAIPRGRLAAGQLKELAEARFVGDRARANGSTIAVLAEYEGRSCLLAGDGFADVITSSLERLRQERGDGPIEVDAFKLPHHGSRHNVSVELLGAVECGTYLFSTDGSVFGHPDREAVARVLLNGGSNPTLAFNYRSEQTDGWSDQEMIDEHGYKALYPEVNQAGLSVDLELIGSRSVRGEPIREG
jgi:beta-lactamase superfamily II metal-dependent hydrolase